MGQGRKKSMPPESRRPRRRSISYEVENSETSALVQYLIPPSNGRCYHGSPQMRSRHQRNPTPFPRMTTSSSVLSFPAPHSPPLTAKNTDRLMNNSPTNVCLPEVPVPPLVITDTNEEHQHSIRHTPNYQIAELLIRTLFPKNYVMQNDKRREITVDLREALHTSMHTILTIIRNSRSLMEVLSSPDGPVRCVLGEHGKQVVMYLVNQCRYENIYGLSVNSALLSQITYFLPHLRVLTEKALYSILVDYVEEECQSSNDGSSSSSSSSFSSYSSSFENAIYVQTHSYGHIHRLVELWSSLTNSLYEHYCTLLFARQQCAQTGLSVTHGDNSQGDFQKNENDGSDEASEESEEGSDDDSHGSQGSHGRHGSHYHQSIDKRACTSSSSSSSTTTTTTQGKSPALVDSQILRQASYLLLRVSGVITKYKPTLLTGLMKLFYIDEAGVREFLKVILAKWPTQSPKKVVEWIQLLQELFENCALFTHAVCEVEVDRVLLRVLHCVKEQHVESCLQALSLLGSDRILLSYIMGYTHRIQSVEHFLQLTRMS